MNNEFKNTKKLKPKDEICFQCTCCGDCCRNVNQIIPIESIDAFRMAKYLRDKGEDISSIEDFLLRYGEPVLIHESGYFAFFLKTQGEDNACVFLENNRCIIHAANPKACRTYPFIGHLDKNLEPEFYVSMERTDHFKGPRVKTKTWMKNRFTDEDQEALRIDLQTIIGIVPVLKRIPKDKFDSIFSILLRYKYVDFDLDKPFLDQYRKNNNLLLYELVRIAE